jgi:hypothetical protein
MMSTEETIEILESIIRDPDTPATARVTRMDPQPNRAGAPEERPPRRLDELRPRRTSWATKTAP